MRRRSLYIQHAAAAITAVCQKFGSLALQYRKLFCAWRLTFVARLVRLACAAAAVHSDVSNSRHVAKLRVNSFAVFTELLYHQMVKCLVCSMYASWISTQDLVAAWGLVIWKAWSGPRNHLPTSCTNQCWLCASKLCLVTVAFKARHDLETAKHSGGGGVAAVWIRLHVFACICYIFDHDLWLVYEAVLWKRWSGSTAHLLTGFHHEVSHYVVVLSSIWHWPRKISRWYVASHIQLQLYIWFLDCSWFQHSADPREFWMYYC